MKNIGKWYSRHQQPRCSCMRPREQPALVAFWVVRMAACCSDEPDAQHACRHPRRFARRYTVAVGHLRSLLTAHADSACAMDHPVGCRGIERHAPPLGPLHGVRRQGCNDPDSRLGWTAGAGARMAEGRHLGAANLCLPALCPLAELVCATKFGVATRTNVCTSFARKVRKPSKRYPPPFEAWVHGPAAQRAPSIGCVSLFV